MYRQFHFSLSTLIYLFVCQYFVYPYPTDMSFSCWVKMPGFICGFFRKITIQILSINTPFELGTINDICKWHWFVICKNKQIKTSRIISTVIKFATNQASADLSIQLHFYMSWEKHTTMQILINWNCPILTGIIYKVVNCIIISFCYNLLICVHKYMFYLQINVTWYLPLSLAPCLFVQLNMLSAWVCMVVSELN